VGVTVAMGGCELGKRDANLIGVGSAASAASYPAGPRFHVLSAKEAEKAFDDASRHIANVTTMGIAKGRDFTESEIDDLYKVMDALRPLWRCENAPLDRFIRVDFVLDGHQLTREWAALAYAHTGLVAYGDVVHNNKIWGFRTVTMHEVAHKLLQNADPRTCTNYVNHYENPLVKEWMATMGWKDPKTLEAPLRAGSQKPELPPTKYGRTEVLEDMADSFVLWLTDRKALATLSPRRAQFFDDLYARLGVAPPTALKEARVFAAETRAKS
jgi:hypothetical protein